MTPLEKVEAEIAQLLFQLKEFHGYVGPSDIEEGCPTPDEIKKQLRELSEERRMLLRSST